MKHQIVHEQLSDFDAEKIEQLFKLHEKSFDKYIDLLLWWNDKVNLVSRGVPRETLYKHIEHSLVISRSNLYLNSKDIIDSGTGGGLPGIPLAIIDSEKSISLNDVVSKKIMACKQIAGSLKLNNITTVSKSIEKVEIKAETVIVSKHAFKIYDLIDMLQQKPWKGIVLLKGKDEVGKELGGIEEELNIKIISLEKGFSHSFYKGKAMVEISRINKYL
ncbi:MAG: RsmG family class I SAM-dependent methyltransferase [Balneolaceae bacterium]